MASSLPVPGSNTTEETGEGNEILNLNTKPVDMDDNQQVGVGDKDCDKTLSAASDRNLPALFPVVEQLTEEILSEMAKSLAPTPKVYVQYAPKAGDIVYVVNASPTDMWVRAQIKQKVWNDSEQRMDYIVTYEPMKKGMVTNGVEDNETTRIERQLTLKQMAYTVPCPFRIPKGTRVIARLKDYDEPDSIEMFYSGIVAEPPRASTKYKYFVIFDTADAQYVYPEHVHLIWECDRKNPWKDTPNYFLYDFVKEYLEAYPNWPLLKMQVGMEIRTEWNGLWFRAKVLELDNSMVRVRFLDIRKKEWIYRGCSRFLPVKQLVEDKQTPVGYEFENWKGTKITTVKNAVE